MPAKWNIVAAGLVGAGVSAAIVGGGLTGGVVGDAGAADPVRVTAEQLRINQRISQAAVRRANANTAAIAELRRSAAPAVAGIAGGPQGAPGPQGPQGPQGPAGAPGAAGGIDSAFTYVESPVMSLAAGAFGVTHASCPEGTRVVSGGFRHGQSVSEVAVYYIENHAVDAVTAEPDAVPSVGRHWRVRAQNVGRNPVTIYATATCARGATR